MRGHLWLCGVGVAVVIGLVVLLGPSAAGGGAWALALLCPLMMIGMMRMMRSDEHSGS